MIDALERAWARTDALFALVPDDGWTRRPIPLRHPPLFYLGHLPAFAWNQLGAGLLGRGPLHPTFDTLFERGIDPTDTDDPTAADREGWPDRAQVLAYRDRVREVLPGLLAATRACDEPLGEGDRAWHLVLEHERLHQETLLYLLQEEPAVGHVPWEPGPQVQPEVRQVHIPRGPVQLGGDFEQQAFGWDNEFPAQAVQVEAFTLDSHPVTLARWQAFLAERGNDPGLVPRSWTAVPGGWRWTHLGRSWPLSAVAALPVHVSRDQALAFCEHHGRRLPTEAELQRAAYTTPAGAERAYPWGDGPPTPDRGTFDFHRWGPSAVGSHPTGASAWGVHELVGNGWEWTATPFRPLPGFTAWARTYPGYSADFFDDAHFVVFGASWATDAKLLRKTLRNWYLGHYPYAFTTFRTASAGTGPGHSKS